MSTANVSIADFPSFTQNFTAIRCSFGLSVLQSDKRKENALYLKHCSLSTYEDIRDQKTGFQSADLYEPSDTNSSCAIQIVRVFFEQTSYHKIGSIESKEPSFPLRYPLITRKMRESCLFWWEML